MPRVDGTLIAFGLGFGTDSFGGKDPTMPTTQTVTVLFTDLVNSTEIGVDLSPKGADQLRATHFGLLRGAVTSSAGNEVKNLGDGLMVVFSSLSRALACAVAMQQAIDRHNRRGDGIPLSVRIGISAGEATEEDEDFFGDPVIEAARLCAKADGGQILATEIVKVVAGRHATQEFRSVGELELKGLPDPVATVEVVWEPTQVSDLGGYQLPLPSRLVNASAESLFAFFGRTEELSVLTEAQKTSAADNLLQTVLLSGEPGIGKTTLVAQASRVAHGSGATVLYGNCDEDLGVPYQPWIMALGQFIERADEAVLREFVEANGSALARLVPALAKRVPAAEPGPSVASEADEERFLIMEGVTRLLALASTTAPLVVVLDDLHWVDSASLQLLRHLVASATPMAVLLVGTFRDSDLSRSHPLIAALAALRREAQVDRVDLDGLDGPEVIELLESAAGHELPEESVAFAHALRRETAGNPFFVVEVIRHLAETGGFIQDDDHQWVLSMELKDLDLPTSVREVVAHRVARLGEETARTLSLASVIGRDFGLEVLAELSGTDEDHLIDLMGGAIGAGLVSESEREAGQFRFVHALIQHTLYQDLGTTRRQRAHLKVAEVLEGSYRGRSDQVAELARHWMAATRPADASKALHYARQAGDLALAGYAPLDAISWYSQALDLLSRQLVDDVRERCFLLVELGTAQRHAGLAEHRETLFEAGRLAKVLGDNDLLIAAALGGSRGTAEASEADAERIELMQAALDSIGDVDTADRARLLVAMAEVIDPRDWQTSRELSREAVSIAGHLGHEATTVDVASRCYLHRCQPESSGARLAETHEAVVFADQHLSPLSRFRARYNRVHACMEVGELVEVDHRLEEMARLVEQTGLPLLRWELAICRCWRLLLAGDPGGAEAANDAALEIGAQSGAVEAMGTYGGILFEIRNEQGRLSEIDDMFVQAAIDNPAIPVLRTAVIQLHVVMGRPERALELFETDFTNGFSDFPRNVTWTTAMVMNADCAVDLGRLDAAERLESLMRPYQDLVAFNDGDVLGSLSRPLGRLSHALGRFDTADADFQSAMAMHHLKLESPYWSTCTRLDYADFLMDRSQPGDGAKAMAMVAVGLDVAQRHGYASMESRARALQSQLGPV